MRSNSHILSIKHVLAGSVLASLCLFSAYELGAQQSGSNTLLELPGLPAAAPVNPPAITAAPIATPALPESAASPVSEPSSPAAPVAAAAPAEPEKPKEPTFLESITKVADKQEKSPAGIDDEGKWNGSLMFSARDISLVNQVALAYSKGLKPELEQIANSTAQSDEDLLNDVMSQLPNGDGVTKPAEEIKPNFPKFYLGSILYFKSNHWSIWLNGKRFNKNEETAEENLTVASISKRKVTLVWKPKAFPELQKKWEEHQLRLAETPKLAGNNAVVFDNEKQEVRFTLMPGQAFHAELMEVHEGSTLAETKKKTTPVSLEAGAAASVTSTTDAAAPNAADVFSSSNPEAALAGKLMNQYKNASEIIPIPDLTKSPKPATTTP